MFWKYSHTYSTHRQTQAIIGLIIGLIIVELQTSLIADSQGVKSAVNSVKNVLKDHSVRLSKLMTEINIKDFATRMLQADLIGDAVARNPSYQAIMDEFLAGLQYSSHTNEVEEDFSKLLGALEDMGGPFKKASAQLKRDVDHIKYLDNGTMQ